MTENKTNKKDTTEIENTEKDKEDKKDKKDKKEKQLESKKKTSSCITERRLQICAWILFTVGLCIVVSAFYLAMLHTTDCMEQINDDLVAIGDVAVELQVKPSDRGFQNEYTVQNKTGRFGFSSIYEIFDKNLNACQEKACQVVCRNVLDIYTSMDNIFKACPCSSIDQLVIEKQKFPSAVLKNLWLPYNITIHELIIRSSNISRIRYNAFNSLLFANTYALTLSHMNIAKIQSGALLGLYSLKYLTIKSKIYRYESAIFQPVQTTLVNLKLNANLRIKGNQNLFDKSYLNKLQYLDLSNNRFNGSLGKNFFKSTPNLKYLTIVESQIESIEEDAFEDLQDKLTFLNLAKNKLTRLTAATLSPILREPKISIINLANNDLICNCELQELTILYQKYRQQFLDILYCKGPHQLFGLTLDELDYEKQNCVISSTTAQNTIESKEVENDTIEISTSFTTTPAYGTETSSSEFVQSSERTSIDDKRMLKMRCSNMVSTDEMAYSGGLEQPAAAPSVKKSKDESDKLQFPAPNFDFELQLLAENNSVIVTIKQPSKLLLIWFNESPFINYEDTSCVSYEVPELIVGPLDYNTTYTFCLLDSLKHDISPFDCLPLHVPAKRQENIWISQDNKDFTIGMLCLIFLLSTIVGGLLAYFGIKTYPDLLEGSKNVLVVKKPDQACYVATISETEYQKQSSIKKQKLNIKDVPLKKQTSIKLPLPDTPPTENSPTPIPMSVKDLERLSSLKSSSTCFEDTFPSYNFADDEYETPKVHNKEYKIEYRCVENIYGMSPKSPPPLPKRNSNVSNSPTLILNRFSTKGQSLN